MSTFVQECRQAGRLMAKSDVVTGLLEKRFGALPDTARAQVTAASEEQLDAWIDNWFDRAITAKSLEEDERRANILIRECLPADIAQRLGKTRGRRVDGAYADILGMKQGDALYEFKVKGKERPSESRTIFVLVKHKYHPDPDTPLQLQDYIVRILERYALNNGGPLLPLVIPLVFYHGDRPWNVPSPFAGIFGKDDPLLDYTPNIQYILMDLVRLKQKDMSQDPGLRALQTAMQKVRHDKKPILKDLPLDLEAAAMSHVLKIADIDRATLDEAAEIAKPERKEMLMGTFAQECWQEGRQMGKSDMVTRLLEKRFDTLPDAERAQVAAASEEQLDAWVDVLITAESLQEALGA